MKLSLHTALQKLVIFYIILKIFTSAIVLPKENEETKLPKEAKIHPFTLPQQKKFIEVIKGHPYESLFLTALYSGLRQGELLALTWDDINFNEKYIDVNKTLAEVADASPEGRGKIERTLSKLSRLEKALERLICPIF